MGAMFGIGSAGAAEMPMTGLASTGTIAGSSPTPLPPVTPTPTIAAPAPIQTAAVEPIKPSVPATIVSEAGTKTASVDTAKIFDQRFKGTPLEGKWDLVSKSASRHGIQPELAAAIMAQETGNGKHFSGTNNPGGVKDFSKGGAQKAYGDIGKGIDDSVRIMAKNYNQAGGNLEKMRDTYAPLWDSKQNVHWLPNVRQIYSRFVPK